jgi:hypothetical protein
MDSEIIKNFKLTNKDYHQGKKIAKQYIFTCRNCNQEISLPDKAQISGKDLINSELALSLHLMACEKYVPKSGPATSV